MASNSDEIQVQHNPDEARFEARVDGVFAGASYYLYRGERILLLHTEVEPAFEGRGVGGALTQLALDTVRERGELTAPLCPFVEGYINRHPEYEDLVDRELFKHLRS